MYINIRKVLKLAEITLPHKTEKIQKIQKSYYFPFICRDYAFENSYGVYSWEAVSESFNNVEDIEQEKQLSWDIANIIADFYDSLRSVRQKRK